MISTSQTQTRGAVTALSGEEHSTAVGLRRGGSTTYLTNRVGAELRGPHR